MIFNEMLVKTELRNLAQQGVIEKVGKPIDWVSPIVAVKKRMAVHL